MAKTTLPRSIVSLTPAEQLELERKASVGKVLDASLQDLVDAPFGAEAIGFRNTLMGSLAWSAGTGLGNLLGDAPKSIPLNLTKRKSEFDPMKDDISFSLSNNPETIATQLRDVPYEEWPYLLTSPDFGTFEDRYRFIMAAQPQMQEQYGSATGKALGIAADISAQMAVGLLAEPLVLSGLPMGQMAGRVGSAVLGNDRVMNASISAAEAVSAVSRTNLALRYGALGIAEEVTYQAARNTFDPAYDPSAADVIYSMTLAGTASSLVGGALFGRTFVRENVEQMVREFKATKATLLPGGYTVTYGRPFAFDSQAAADEMLFAPGTGTFLWEADRIARDLFDDWARTSTYGKPGFRMEPDLFIPGTRSMGLPVLDEAATAAEQAARSAPAAAQQISPAVSAIPLNRTALANRKLLERTVLIGRDDPRFALAPAERVLGGFNNPNLDRQIVQGSLVDLNLSGPVVFHETSTKNAESLIKRLEGGFRRHEALFVSDNIDLAQGQGGRGIILELDPNLLNGTVNKARSLSFNLANPNLGREFVVDRSLVGNLKALIFKNPEDLAKYRKSLENTFDFDNVTQTERGLRVARKAEAKAAKVAKVGEEPVFEAAEAAKFTPVAEVRDAAGRIPAKPKLGELMGMRSAIKAAAQELSVAGAKMDSVLFSKVAQALVKTELTKVRMGAFNKAFWEEVSKDLPPEVVAKLRPAGERTFIAGIDRTLQDLTTRESMVDSVWEYFRFGRHKEFKEKEDASLIFQVLQEVRNRGGTVNRNTVADVVDELRVISQNPPKRMNKKGVLTTDLNARRAAVIEVINKRAKDGRKIHVNNELVKRLNPGKMALGKPAAGGVGGGGRVGDIGGGAAGGGEGRAGLADASDVAKALPWWHNLPGLGVIGNQSAYAHTSDNGWARLIANLGFNARRDYGTAQQFTIMEKGLQAYYSLMGNYLRAYKTAYIRFAMGNGVDNIARDVDITDALVTTFKGKGMRRDFDRRVAAQLRTGAYDDSVEAVNEAAQEMRRILNKVHDIAHASGLKGFQKTAVVNYFPRVWRWDRIRRLSTTEEGRKALTALVKQSIDQNGRKVVMDGVETTFTEDIDDAAKVFAERLMAIANKTENAPTVQQEQELFDAIVGLEGPLKDKVGSKTPFGRSRILLDETATISTSSDLLNKGEGLGLGIADLSNDDLPFVFRKYLTSVLGAVNEKELLNAFNSEMKARGVLGPKMTKRGKEVRGEVEVTGIDEMFAMARKLGGVIEPRHESALREVVSALRFEPIHHGRTAVGDKVLQIVLPLGYLSTGGQFGLAQIGEIARIVGTLGIRQVVEQMPILTEMLQNWKNLDKPTQNMASLMDSWFSPSTERLRRVISQGVGDLTPDPYSNVAARTLSSMANVMSDVSLLAPATSFTQQLTAATTMQHLWEVSKGLSRRLDDSTLRTLGVNTQQYQELVDYVGKNAQTRAGFLGDRIVGMNNIDGIQMDLLKSFVDRMVRTRVQDMPTRGDFHKSMFSFVGKLMTQFRSFNIKGVDNFLMQNVSRTRNGGGATVAQEIVATLMFAGTIQYLRNWADWKSYTAAGDRERADDTAKRMDFAGMVRGAFTGPSEFFVPGFVMDTIWTKAIDKDPILSPYRYSGLDLYGFPGWAIGERSGGIVRDVYGATVGRTMGLDLEREITKGTIHKARLLLPFQNLLFVKQYLNIAEQEIADYYNLSDIQPRRRPE